MTWNFGKKMVNCIFSLLQKLVDSSRIVIDRKSITITKEVH